MPNDYLMSINGLTEADFDPRDRVADLNAKLDALMEFQGLTVREMGGGVFEVVKQQPQTGDYTDPIPWVSGMAVELGKWYYADDRDLPHEAIASGVPSSFVDTAFFDFVE